MIAKQLNPVILGVLNVTPDSFSDGGSYMTEPNAMAQALWMIRTGAHYIDIGAESTGPGSMPVSESEEMRRLLLCIRELSQTAPVSVDTYKAYVARLCLEYGAKMINDVSGLRADPDMPKSIAEHQAKVVIMHSTSKGPTPHVDQSQSHQLTDISHITDFLFRRVDYALSAGIPEQNIILDPGMGAFLSTNPQASWDLLRQFPQLVDRLRPFPVMIATSRKGFLGGDVSARDPLSQLTALYAVENGATYVRTHNPQMMKSFLEAAAKIGNHKCDSLSECDQVI